MTSPELEEAEIARALRRALNGPGADVPSRDLWPEVIERTRRHGRWSWADWSAAALIAMALLLFPKWFWFCVYHL